MLSILSDISGIFFFVHIFIPVYGVFQKKKKTKTKRNRLL